jgi:serine/threonine protein phosphatase PrpC
MKLPRAPRRPRNHPPAEPDTERLPGRTERGPGVGQSPPGAHPFEDQPTRSVRSSSRSLPVIAGLPTPPAVGRISSAWESHLASSDWPRPGLVADYGTIGPIVLAAASTTGRTHAHRGGQRQDAYGFKLISDVLVCAVADGVSSTRFGGLGADVAVATALSSADVLPPGATRHDLEWLQFAAGRATRAVQKLADGIPEEASQFASTLVLAAIRRSRGRGFLHLNVLSIGDSSALELTPRNEVNVIVGPRSKKDSQKLRDYIPDSASRLVGAKCIIPARSALLLVTDGLADDLRDSETVRHWVGQQLRSATSMVAAANVLSYARQRSGDDRTFVSVRQNLSD